jgi:hypothetical protein
MNARGPHVTWLVALLAISVGLGACGKMDHATPPQPSVSSSPNATPPVQPPSQTAQAGETNRGETAKGTDEPMKSMTKDEESKAMPQPGQANDHSTVAKDPKEETK